MRTLAMATATATLISAAMMTGCDSGQPTTGSVIFIHPDGASAATWTAARAYHVGPDGDLQWDQLPAIAVYRGHMGDSLTATSNGGATTHAFGVKVASDAFGRTRAGAAGADILDAHGRSLSIADQAMRIGLPVGLVQTGIAPEPGTACFVAPATRRKDYEGIAAGLVASDADLLFSGGERYFLPEGVPGVHGRGVRTDGRNLVDEARAAGYVVIHTREELLALPARTDKVLGLFSDLATFHDQSEEDLRAQNLPLYEPAAPTVAEMTDVALRVLSAKGSRFLLVIEEEATDNFGNKNNAIGVLEAAGRADEAFGVARRYVARAPETLLITAADSDGSGLRMVGIPWAPGDAVPETLPAQMSNGAPVDGVAGTGSAPFIAQPDQFGQRLPFFVTWSSLDDVSGAVLVRAEGMNSDLVRGSMDNTDVTRVMRTTLFGNEQGPE